MGTRSVLAVNLEKQTKKGPSYRFQYLQFDGYPTCQLRRILEAVMPKMSRVDIDWNQENAAKRFREFLEAYFKFRSFDSGHSIGNTWVGPMLTPERFSDKCWAEWLYVFEPNWKLIVTCVRTKRSQTIDLMDSTIWASLGYEKYSDGLTAKANAFCKMVEKSLQKD